MGHRMRNLLEVKFDKFVEDYDLQGDVEDANWRRFVNYHFSHNSSLGVLTLMLIY